jgi:phosphoesterase RecJ-like protein
MPFWKRSIEVHRVNMDTKTIDRTEALIRDSDHIWIGCHKVPDGDAIGSTLGLMWGLRQLGKRCVPACSDPVPPPFAFLSGAEEFVARKPGDENLIIVLDCGSIDRIGDIYDPAQFGRVPVVNIDHHATNTHFGDVNLVQITAATAEMVYALLVRLGAEITSDIATCLLSGLMTDTRSFRTSNTTVDTLRVATALTEAGANLAELSYRIYSQMPFTAVGLWGQALESARTRGRIAWTEITKAMMEQTDAPLSAARGIVSFLASTREADVGIVFTEDDHEGIGVEMRSIPGVDIAEVALSLGGGGHAQASGCTLNGRMEEVRERVLAAVEASLSRQDSSSATGAHCSDEG